MDVEKKKEAFMQHNDPVERLTRDKSYELVMFAKTSEGIEYLNRYGSDLIIIARSAEDQERADKEGALALRGNNCEYSKQICNPYEQERVKPTAVTFGRFDLMVRGVSVNFHNSKAAELLALCIDRRGVRVDIYDAIEKLWPGRKCDDTSKRMYRRAVKRIEDVLRELGAGNIFSRGRGFCCVIPDNIKCDYYDFLDGDREIIGSFGGMYMTDYSWAESTLAKLTSIKMSKR